MRMLFKITGSLLLMSLLAFGQQGDDRGVKMDPVVPEKLIPPSPVLTIDQALKTFDLAAGFIIEPVAAEPLVDTPVCLDFDPAGRMWVCEMRGYMPDIDGKKESDPQGRIVILEDTNADGKVDKRTVFLEKLLLPRAISVFQDGVLFIDEKRICWIKRNGDAPVGAPQVIDTKLLQAGNVEHKPNGLLSNLDNRYYLAKSDRRMKREGDTWVMETSTFRGQWGVARDDYGRLYHNNNSTLLFGDLLAPDLLLGNPDVKMKVKDYIQLGSNKVWPVRVTPAVNRAYIAKAHGFDNDTLDPKTYKLISATAASGMTIYRGTNFPAEWQGTAFVTEPVCNLVKAIRITEKDGELKGEHPLGEKEFLASTDERFRPVNAYTAPDGSLYILDMYHGIIQHNTYMTSYLRKQTLDRGLDSPPYGYGRIYRIRSKAGKTQPVTNLTNLRGLELVRVLLHPNAWQREMAQRLMVERKDAETIPLLEKLTKSGTPIQKIHAFWTLEGMGALKADSLLTSIQSKDAKLQSSALWASTRLDAAELTKLAPALLAASPASDEMIPYLARALGPIGTPAAFKKLSELITKKSKVPFVRESAVSGLDQHETAFKDACLKESKDNIFIGWLEQGARDGKSKVAVTHLTGESLTSFERGKKLFLGEAACFGCHGADGDGMPNLGPPLDASEWVTGNPKILLNILLHGMTGPVTVDGESYTPESDMPALGANPAISDQDLADISTYIRNEWSNKSVPITLPQAKYQREATKERGARPWTAAELGK